MGETKIQQKVFTLMMCFGMVLGMTTYNIILHVGWNSEVFQILVKEIGIVFVVAFILDDFVVGPFAKRQVFARIKPDTKKIIVIMSISISMVVCMVLLMSIFGVLFSKGLSIDALRSYPHTVMMNFLAALPLNVLIVSPLMRGLFLKIFRPQMGT